MNSIVTRKSDRYSTGRTWVAFGLVTAIALALLGVGASGAQAEKIAGGTTKLKVDKPVAKVLKRNGVSLAPVKPAKVMGGGVVFPITGGDLNLKTAAGTLRHSGGLRFAAGGKKLVATSFVVKTGKGNVLSGKVGGSRVNLLKLNLSKAKVKRNGLGLTVSKVGASLTGTAAKALNATFGVKLFKKGLRLGHVAVDAVPESVALAASGSTDLALDPGTARALTDLGVAAAPIGGATALPSGELSFPITGGKANTSTFAGAVRHSGGFSLTAGSTVVELTNFTINVDGQPDLTALIGGTRVSILSLDLSELEADVSGRRITLGNVTAKLTAAAADALNGAFGVAAFTEGLVLGKATVNAVAS
ncbi:MAG: hypothetical protein ACSLFI_11540 [Solirubrobacterales bacterium]